ncbi:MAG: hypothetical protein ABF760_06715 [Zymomonas mobilis]|uniref:Uncharacterized protein n=1 Tax=Zymomonas mobilis TaxID=542 RepID=A0A542VZA6_ZYMMB|nr:hypothetical protein [Zymomonas mobilis]TQL16660.1 hypothetical protein FBY58_0196 [Zymomonas mobilis]
MSHEKLEVSVGIRHRMAAEIMDHMNYMVDDPEQPSIKPTNAIEHIFLYEDSGSVIAEIPLIFKGEAGRVLFDVSNNRLLHSDIKHSQLKEIIAHKLPDFREELLEYFSEN